VSYYTAHALGARHGLDPVLAAPLGVVAGIADTATHAGG
jgi:hypothetical protein